MNQKVYRPPSSRNKSFHRQQKRLYAAYYQEQQLPLAHGAKPVFDFAMRPEVEAETLVTKESRMVHLWRRGRGQSRACLQHDPMKVCQRPEANRQKRDGTSRTDLSTGLDRESSYSSSVLGFCLIFFFVSLSFGPYFPVSIEKGETLYVCGILSSPWHQNEQGRLQHLVPINLILHADKVCDDLRPEHHHDIEYRVQLYGLCSSCYIA